MFYFRDRSEVEEATLYNRVYRAISSHFDTLGEIPIIYIYIYIYI